MTGFWWILVVVGALTLLGSGALFFVTIKYYWGERGVPPLTGEERRMQHQAELEKRAKQIEYSEKHPRRTRKPTFWDNRKPN